MKITFVTKKEITIKPKNGDFSIKNREELFCLNVGQSMFTFSRWTTADACKTVHILPGTHNFVGGSQDFERFCRKGWNPFDTPWVAVYFVELENASMACEWDDLPPSQKQIDQVYDDWPEPDDLRDVAHTVN